MPTVELISAEQAPLLARPYFAGGDPGPIVAALAHVPEILVPALDFIAVTLGPSALSWRVKELIIVRTSALAGCRFCVQSHAVVALDAGLCTAEIAALRDPSRSASAAFRDGRESALLTWVDKVAGGGAVQDGDRTAVLAHWSDYEVVEVTVVIGTTLLLNRFATALALPTSPEVVERLSREGLL